MCTRNLLKVHKNIAAPYFSRNKDQKEDSFCMCVYLACSLLVAKVRVDAIFKSSNSKWDGTENPPRSLSMVGAGVYNPGTWEVEAKERKRSRVQDDLPSFLAT